MAESRDKKSALELIGVRDALPLPMSVNLLHDQGFTFYCLNLYPYSIISYTRALEKKADPYDYYWRAKNYMALGYYEEAINDLSRAISLKKDPIYYETRADCRIRMANIDMSRPYDADTPVDSIIVGRILQDYDRGITIFSPRISQHAEKMKFLNAIGRFQEAIHEAKIVLELYQEQKQGLALDSNVRTWLSNALVILEWDCYHRAKFDSCGVYLDQLDDLHIKANNVPYRRGLVLNAMKKYSAAVDQFQEAIRFASDSSDCGYLYLALAKSQQLAVIFVVRRIATSKGCNCCQINRT